METSAEAIENGGVSSVYSEMYPKLRDSAAQKLSSCNCGGWGGFGGCGLWGFVLGSQASPGGHQGGVPWLPPPEPRSKSSKAVDHSVAPLSLVMITVIPGMLGKYPASP